MSETIQTIYTPEQITDAVRAALQPIMIYDEMTDRRRPITQGDVDRLLAISYAMAEVGRVLRHLKPGVLD